MSTEHTMSAVCVVCGVSGRREWWQTAAACCCSGRIACFWTVTFVYISRQPSLWSWTWLYRKKGEFDIEFNDVICVGKYCQLITHESISDQYVISHWKESSANAKKYQKPCQKQHFLLEARGISSNTWMPWPTPLTTPNDSSMALCTSTQRRNKVPVGYNRTPQIHPQNCHFPFDDHHQNLIHPYRARPHSPPKWHPNLISRFATAHMWGRTNGTDECSITWALRSIESDALTTTTTTTSPQSNLRRAASQRPHWL